MSDLILIPINEEDRMEGAKRVPVCICLDTEIGMSIIRDKDLIRDGNAIYQKHKKEMTTYDKGFISVEDLVNNYYDELSVEVRKKYGMTKEEMKKRQVDMETGAKQCKEVLKTFFKTLREKRQNDIDADILILTFSGGEVQVFEPFTSGKVWDSDEWVDRLLQRASQIEYKKKEKSMVLGLKKAIDMLNARTNAYVEQSIDSIRGRIVLLTLEKKSEEEKTMEDEFDRINLEGDVEEGLKSFKNICVVLDKKQNNQNNELAGLKFPDGTQFIDPKKKGLEEVFKAISVSVSSGSDANIQKDLGDNGDDTE